ncbi:carboxypeptidase-like regulatory domain-containing protein [soil metagenome]
MTDPNTHINYTIEDIERYLTGGMSAKEMHDMERAALHDPFLADAIEGYSEASMQQSNKHLNEITALLQNDKQDAKVVTMPTKSFQWWKVAAMIIVIAGVGIFSWYLIGINKPDDVQNVAVVKENVEPAMKQDSNISSAKPHNGLMIAENKAGDEMAVLDKKSQQLQKADKSVGTLKRTQETAANLMRTDDTDNDGEGDIMITEPDSTALIAATDFAPGIDVNKAKAKPIFSPMQGRGAGVMNNNGALNNFSGFVMDNNSQPVPNALINAGHQRAAFTDKNGYFNMFAPDSTLRVSVSSVGYETTDVNLSLGYANKIAIEPDEASLSEMVVTGYSSNKKAVETVKSNGGDTTFPAGGWQSFQEYVYKKINKPFDSTNNEIITPHGSVEIEFSVDEDGDPYNINVVKSSGTKNDEQVIQAIKEGPRWISSKKHKKSKVVIRF